jgi:hypothetical protein
MAVQAWIALLGELVRKFVDKFGYVRTENRLYVAERYRSVLDYVVKPGGRDLGFVATVFSYQSGDLGKMFRVRFVRPFAPLSQLAVVVQNQAMSQLGEPFSPLYEVFRHSDHGKSGCSKGFQTRRKPKPLESFTLFLSGRINLGLHKMM